MELWSGEGKVVNTTAFKAQIQKYAPRFMGYNQQDAQEFLRYLLQGLHDDINRVTTKPRHFPQIDDNLRFVLKKYVKLNFLVLVQLILVIIFKPLSLT